MGEQEGPAVEGRTITLVSELPETKTHMNDAMDNILWDGKEKAIHCYLDNVFHNGKDTKAQSDDTRAKLTITLSNITGTPSEVSGYIGLRNDKQEVADPEDAGKVALVAIELPAIQNITSKTFDATADALVMTPKAIDPAATTIDGIRYNRLNAITKLAFSGLETYNGETITSIEFAPSKKEICGTFLYDYRNMTFVENAGQPAPDPQPTPAVQEGTATTIAGYTPVATPTFLNKSAGKNITLKYTENTAITEGALTAWIVLPQGEISAKFPLTVKITTDKHVIEKTTTPASRLKLDNTKLNILNVGMADATVTEIAPSGDTYQVVTNVSELNTTDEYYLCSHDNKIFDGGMDKEKGVTVDANAVTIDSDNSVTGMPATAKAIKLEGNTGAWKLLVNPDDHKNAYFSYDGSKLKFMSSKNTIAWNITIDESGNCTMTTETVTLYSYEGYMQTAATAPTPANLPKLIRKVPAAQ